MPKTIEDASTLAEYAPFKFEKWAASLTFGREANKKQRGDGGIDGWGRLPSKKGVFVDVASQVKGENAACAYASVQRSLAASACRYGRVHVL